MTAVGGTTTGISQSGNLAVNTGWEATGNALIGGKWVPTTPAFVWGAGGGPSAYFDKPSWQAGVPGDKRTIPDVAALADPYTGFFVGYTYQGVYQEGGIGGTSLASPIIASLVAVAQSRAGTGEPVGLLAPILYARASAGMPVTTDITHTAAGILVPGIPGAPRGQYLIDVDSTPQALHTVPGYDMVTGLGVPNARFLTEITR